MKKIDINEAHQILLGIAKAFSKVCDDNNIPYYMLGGTMLGAIRHNGFIPWDDDMDFGVPREFFDNLLNCLQVQLPYPYRCCTYKNGLNSSFIVKIDDCRTTVNDINHNIAHSKRIGLNIDIFPLDYCGPDDKTWWKEKLLTFIYRAKFSKNTNWSISRRIINNLVNYLIPWSAEEINTRKERILINLEPCPYLSNVFGAWGIKECIPIDWYGDGVKYKFENTEFNGIKEYDRYLHQIYGDYMTPPSENPHIHLDGVYWNDLNDK